MKLGEARPALLLLLGAGCNLMDWATDESSFDALMADGRAAIQAGDYPLAEAKFTAAAELRPTSADARYHVAKAAVLKQRQAKLDRAIRSKILR